MSKPINDLDWKLDDDLGTDATIEPISQDPVDNDPPVDPIDSTDPIDVVKNDDTTITEPITQSELSPLYQFLKQRGIEDPSKIKFENEEGETEDFDFNALSAEEQLTILEEITNSGLSAHETEVVNYLRQNNVTLEQVVEHFAEQRLQKYLEENPDQVKPQIYSIDDYTDDELYLADLKSKYTSFTDEELQDRLNSAKVNEELFKKETEILRNNYKAEEDRNRELEKQQADQYYEDLKNNLVNAASNFNEVSLDYSDPESDTLIIEDEDRQQIINYLLEQDSDGKSQFVKDIDDPQTLIELAWFRTQGAEVISGITKYWKDVLKAERKEKSKLEKQIASLKTPTTQTVVASQDPSVDSNKIPDIWSLGSKANL